MRIDYQLMLLALSFGAIAALAMLYFGLKAQIKKLAESLNTTHKSLTDEIKNSVQTKFIDVSPSTQSLVELGIEIWRLEKKLEKASQELSDDQKTSLQNSLMKLRRHLEKNDIEVRDYTDQKYNDGMNLEILSSEKHPNLSHSVVGITDTPAIMHKGQIIKRAKVVIYEK